MEGEQVPMRYFGPLSERLQVPGSRACDAFHDHGVIFKLTDVCMYNSRVK